MTAYLLDVNVLIALAWPQHVHHRLAQNWFARVRAASFSTCPLTQTGFVRISSNPAFTPDAVSPVTALHLLGMVTALAEHQFWPDDLSLGDAFTNTSLILGHRQITDAYLLALARAHGGILATLDRALLALPAGQPGGVELLS